MITVNAQKPVEDSVLNVVIHAMVMGIKLTKMVKGLVPAPFTVSPMKTPAKNRADGSRHFFESNNHILHIV
jgi:hypothetical protein